MKKILTLMLTAAMLLSTLVVSTNAAGSLIFKDDFEMGFKPINWIQGSSCEFKWDSVNKCLMGYDSAVVLQNNFDARDAKKWDQFYSSYDFQIRGFDDLVEERDSHSVGMWYRDLFENEGSAQGAVYTYFIEIETGKATFRKEHTFDYRDENNILQEGKVNVILGETVVPGVPEEIPEGETAIPVAEDAPWFEIGMRVTTGKIECYFEQQLVFSFEVNPNDEMLGHIAKNSIDSTVGSQKSGILFWNSGNYVGVDNFEVWTPDYDFVAVTYGDVNGDTKINLGDVSAMLNKIAKWDVTIDETAADVDVNGKVNLADVSLVLKHIAKWEVELGVKA